MAQPQIARITCSECNAWYSSERELRDHMQMAHRKFVSENSLPSSFVHADVKRGCTTSFLTEERNEMDKLCERTPAEQQEEYNQPDEEKEAGGEA
jgi:Zn-finger nucleic acid-binding protein